MNWTILKLLQWSEEFLRGKGVESPRLDAELLLGRVLDLPRVQLYAQFDRPLAEAELGAFKALLTRRASREPLAYILGEKEFFSLRLAVNTSVLIPRPETEELVERGLDHLKALRAAGATEFSVLDLATGSGCALIAVLKNFPEASGLGLDVSTAALEVAQANAVAHGLSDRAAFRRADLSQGWETGLSGRFHLVLANLPYVSESDWSSLEPEIRDFEPKLALVPGPEGTEALAWVLPKLEGILAPSGAAWLEIGMDQGPGALAAAGGLGPGLSAEVQRDLSGRDRFIKIGFILSGFIL